MRVRRLSQPLGSTNGAADRRLSIRVSERHGGVGAAPPVRLAVSPAHAVHRPVVMLLSILMMATTIAAALVILVMVESAVRPDHDVRLPQVQLHPRARRSRRAAATKRYRRRQPRRRPASSAR
jgi:hypothetical protein